VQQPIRIDLGPLRIAEHPALDRNSRSTKPASTSLFMHSTCLCQGGAAQEATPRRHGPCRARIHVRQGQGLSPMGQSQGFQVERRPAPVDLATGLSLRVSRPRG
jgi:hypothetical protein